MGIDFLSLANASFELFHALERAMGKAKARHVALSILAFVVAGMCGHAGGQDVDSPVPWASRIDYKQARRDRDAADMLFAEYQKARYQKGSKAEDAARRAEEALSAVVKRYPKTAIAGYCQLRISGLYQLRGKYAEAIKSARVVVDTLPGTEQDTRARYAIGTLYLQCLHQPRTAINWYKSIRKLNDDELARPTTNHANLYFAAQMTLARAHRMLRETKAAETVYAELKSIYKGREVAIESARKFPVQSLAEVLGGEDPDAHYGLTISDPRFLDPVATGEPATRRAVRKGSDAGKPSPEESVDVLQADPVHKRRPILTIIGGCLLAIAAGIFIKLGLETRRRELS